MHPVRKLLPAIALLTCPALVSALEAPAPSREDRRELPAAARPSLALELGAGPMIGLDEPLRGAQAGLFLGLGWGPVEAGLRAGAAYDRSLRSPSLRLDFELGLGGGIRAIVGGLLPLASPVIEPDGAALSLEPSPWPCRFGIAAALARSPRGPLGSRVAASAQIVYCAYRVPEGAAASPEAVLSGAAAFAACVEACVTISLAWPSSGGP